ncbi:hypothetical protein GCM10020254_01730 [Streptomyces goshikiensis]
MLPGRTTTRAPIARARTQVTFGSGWLLGTIAARIRPRGDHDGAVAAGLVRGGGLGAVDALDDAELGVDALDRPGDGGARGAGGEDDPAAVLLGALPVQFGRREEFSGGREQLGGRGGGVGAASQPVEGGLGEQPGGQADGDERGAVEGGELGAVAALDVLAADDGVDRG